MSTETLDSEAVFNFGKHKGRTFIYVYNNDEGYVNWIKSLPNPSGTMLSFLEFSRKYEMCKNLTSETKGSKIGDEYSTKCVLDKPDLDVENETPKPVKLESIFGQKKYEMTPNKMEEESKRRKMMNSPTPGDVSIIKDADYEKERSLLSPSLKHILDVLTKNEDEELDSDIEIEGLLSIVLFSENEFYLSYNRNKGQFGRWTCYIPAEVQSFITNMGLNYNTRALGKERCITFNASDYNNLIKGLRNVLRDKTSLETVPSFVLRVFPEFLPFSRDAHLEEKTRLILTGKQDEYTMDNMENIDTLIGESLWDKLMPFQKEGVLFGIKKNGRVLIGDEMGLGKTLQALAISAFYQKDWPLLIICPSSLRFQWMDQCLTWLPHLVSKSDVLMVKSSKNFTRYKPGFDGIKLNSFIDFENKLENGGFPPGVEFGLLNDTKTSGSNGLRKPEFVTGLYKVIIISYDLIIRIKEFIDFSSVICDESHYIKNRSAQRSRRIVPILKSAKRAILLSGTPALNFPSELYEQVSSIMPGFSSCHAFIERYCKKRTNWFTKRTEYVDSKHANELHLFLVNTVMIRRLKNDVLTELPPKIRSKIPIEIPEKLVKTTRMMLEKFPRHSHSPKSESTWKDDDFRSGGCDDADKSPSSLLNDRKGVFRLDVEDYYDVVVEHLSRFEDGDGIAEKDGNVKKTHLTLMSKLFQLTGESKTKGVCKYVEEILENKDKFIIFAHHMFMLDAIEDTLKSKNVGYIRIDGSTNMNDRGRLVHIFQSSGQDVSEDTPSRDPKSKDYVAEEEKVRVALLGLTSCGVGLNLTSASTVIFAELYWVPGVLLQAEDRAHRIGTKFNKININYLIAQNSVEEVMWRVINKKYQSVTTTLDGTRGNLSLLINNKKKRGNQTTLDQLL